MDLYEPTEDMEKVVTDMLVQLLHLGMYIHKNQKVTIFENLDFFFIFSVRYAYSYSLLLTKVWSLILTVIITLTV